MSRTAKLFLAAAGACHWALSILIFPKVTTVPGAFSTDLILLVWALFVLIGTGCVFFALVAPTLGSAAPHPVADSQLGAHPGRDSADRT